jgi:hypothetical protein
MPVSIWLNDRVFDKSYHGLARSGFYRTIRSVEPNETAALSARLEPPPFQTLSYVTR